MELMNALAIRLKAILKEKGCSYKELVSRSKVPLSYIKNLFNGKLKNIKLTRLARILKCLDLMLPQFFQDDILKIQPLKRKVANNHNKSLFLYQKKQGRTLFF